MVRTCQPNPAADSLFTGTVDNVARSTGVVVSADATPAVAKLMRHVDGLARERGLTPREVWELLSVDPNRHMLLSVAREPLPAFAERRRWAAAFGVEHAQFEADWRRERVRLVRGSELLEGGGTSKATVAVVNVTPAGEPIDYSEHGVGSGEGFAHVLPPPWLEAEALRGELFGFAIVGDSMAPTMLEGDLILARPVDASLDAAGEEARRALSAGSPAFVRIGHDAHTDDGRRNAGCCTFKEWHPLNKSAVALRPRNPAHAELRIERDEIDRLAEVAHHEPGWLERHRRQTGEHALHDDEPRLEPAARTPAGDDDKADALHYERDDFSQDFPEL